MKMYALESMEHEHEQIRQFAGVVRRMCCEILEGAPVPVDDLEQVIHFVRVYADQYHHGKEEKCLFEEMTAQLGSVAVNLIQHGMLVEHDLGRLHIFELENARKRYAEEPNTLDKLRIVTEASGYAELMQRHLEKENQVLFPFALRQLPQQSLEKVQAAIERFEEQSSDLPRQELERLHRLAEKYPPICK